MSRLRRPKPRRGRLSRPLPGADVLVGPTVKDPYHRRRSGTRKAAAARRGPCPATHATPNAVIRRRPSQHLRRQSNCGGPIEGRRYHAHATIDIAASISSFFGCGQAERGNCGSTNSAFPVGRTSAGSLAVSRRAGADQACTPRRCPICSGASRRRRDCGPRWYLHADRRNAWPCTGAGAGDDGSDAGGCAADQRAAWVSCLPSLLVRRLACALDRTALGSHLNC